MAKMSYDKEYYYLNNPDNYVNQAMLKIGMNFRGFFRYMKDIVNTKISMFQYEGELPTGLTSTIIEEALMFKCRLCLADVAPFGWTLCSYEPINEYNIYHRPTTVKLTTFSGIDLGTVPYDDIILVRDNSMDIPPILVIKEYVDKIVDIEGKMDKMLTISCLPVGIVGNKKLANQFKQTAQALGTSNPFIAGDDSLMTSLQTFGIDVPIKPAEVYAIRKKYINECMASLGIYAVEAKKERLVVSEIQSQNDYTDFIYVGMTNERNRWIGEYVERSGKSLRLVESYDTNAEATAEEQAQRAALILKQEAEAIKSVDPEASFGGGNPVKLNTTGGNTNA